MKPDTNHAPGWRPCPFEIGRRYRVTKPVRSLRDSFEIGEALTFFRAGYSVYHSITGYFFKDAGGTIRAFDVADDVGGDEWQQNFELID
jgi:hypothetical protein